MEDEAGEVRPDAVTAELGSFTLPGGERGLETAFELQVDTGAPAFASMTSSAADEPAPPRPPRPGAVERAQEALGAAWAGDDARYEVCEEVARGGMGRVLRVQDRALNRDVARKELLEADSPQVVRRFVEEAQLTSQLDHPGVLPVHDIGLDPDGRPYFTMKFIRSLETLQHVITRLRAGDAAYHQRFSFERRVQIVQHVCNALQYAHERGVVHRDIKPANIILGAHGEVYLLDWGVAKLSDPPAVSSGKPPSERVRTVRTSNTGRLDATAAGALLGTFAYMAPEQVLAKHDEVDVLTDTYALSAVLYELLCLEHHLGKLGTSLKDLIATVVNRRPTDAEEFRSPHQGRVPRALSRICRKGLMKVKEERFQSANELREHLQRWLEGNAPIVCPGTAIQRLLSGYSSLIDQRPVLVPAVSLTLVGLLLIWLVVSALLLAFG